MNDNKSNKLIGCLSYGVALFIASILFGLIHNLFNINSIWLFAICYFLSLRIVQYSLYLKNLKKINTGFIIITIGVIIFIRNFSSFNSLNGNNDFSDDFIATKHININNDSIEVYSHNRKWRDYSGNNYSGDFNVRTKDYLSSKSFHNKININKEHIWKELYSRIVNEDINKLDLILKEFYYIHKFHQLNQREFAEMVVSFVQDIPYALVFQGNCLDPDAYEDTIKEILEECPECCIGNQKFGIQTPVEFLSNLKGDCDTRTMLIFAILKYFGYDVAILNSDFYLHSVIGITLPSTGSYKMYYGKKYYLWETTNKHYKIGQLPNHLKNINHWYVVLTSKP